MTGPGDGGTAVVAPDARLPGAAAGHPARPSRTRSGRTGRRRAAPWRAALACGRRLRAPGAAATAGPSVAAVGGLATVERTAAGAGTAAGPSVGVRPADGDGEQPGHRQHRRQRHPPPSPVHGGGQWSHRLPHSLNVSKRLLRVDGWAERARRPGAAGTLAPCTLPDLVSDWYRVNARDLPWRRPGTTPWGVLVSEFMLQQTPVARVEPIWREWMERWPRPSDLAAAPRADVLRAWGRLGYPRRALRLHEAAQAVAEQHGDVVPATWRRWRRCPASAPTRPGPSRRSATAGAARSSTRTSAGWSRGPCTVRATPGRRGFAPTSPTSTPCCRPTTPAPRSRPSR